MTRSVATFRRSAVVAACLVVLLAMPAAAQYLTFPRIGVSVAPDRYVPEIAVHGSEPFELHVIAVPAEGQQTFVHDYGQFQWAVLEACCGGAAEIITEVYNPACEHVGAPYSGVVTTSEECMSGEVVWICTLTVQMVVDQSGSYYVSAGPLALSQTCDGQDVVMTDLMVYVDYTSDVTPVEGTSLSEVKALFD